MLDSTMAVVPTQVEVLLQNELMSGTLRQSRSLNNPKFRCNLADGIADPPGMALSVQSIAAPDHLFLLDRMLRLAPPRSNDDAFWRRVLPAASELSNVPRTSETNCSSSFKLIANIGSRTKEARRKANEFKNSHALIISANPALFLMEADGSSPTPAGAFRWGGVLKSRNFATAC